MKTAQYLDLAKKALGIATDYALAKHLGTTTSRIGNWRAGRSLPDALMCERLAKITGIADVRVIADVQAERSSNPEEIELWRRIAKRVAVAVLPAIAAAIAAPSPAEASMPQSGNPPVYYVRSRRWWLFPLIPPLMGGDDHERPA
jgi:hypothetical protein